MNKKILPAEFYLRNTKQVARDLIGKKLVHRVNGQRLSGLIVETEAYLGLKDPAAHSFGGRRTNRVSTMYLQGGHAYVYFIYGMHYCFNVVTRSIQHPEAVLIRAIEPLESIDEMKKLRGPRILLTRDLANGPAKLCQALRIDKSCDKMSLQGPELFIEDVPLHKKFQIKADSRIGIDYAGEAAHWPLRFFIKNHPMVSA